MPVESVNLDHPQATRFTDGNWEVWGFQRITPCARSAHTKSTKSPLLHPLSLPSFALSNNNGALLAALLLKQVRWV